MIKKMLVKKKHSLWVTAVVLAVFVWAGVYVFFIFKDLPPAYSLSDYKPPLLSFVYDRNGRLIGEFFKQRRILTPYQELPEFLIQAFVSAEDGTFFKHKGINLKSIFRAFLANLKAGKKVQGGSTITQQTARSLLLSSKKTYTRKLKEAILAFRMERHLTKSEILYLYLNQIYLGHGAYGVGMASKIYFKKEVKNLTLEEAALLAGLPQAPSRFSPISNAKKAKERQIYVLTRMAQENYISSEQALTAKKKPIAVYTRENYSSRAPYFVETLRQILLDELGEKTLLEGGLAIETSLDLDIQKAAEKHLKKGLQNLDKRQGYRGPLKNISDPQEIADFLASRQKKWISEKKTRRLLLENGEDGIPASHYEILTTGDLTQGVIQEVQEDHALVKLMFSLEGLIPLETTKWARVPNKKTDARWSQINSLHSVFKKGDVVWVQLEELTEHKKIRERLMDVLKARQLLSLEQEPLVQGALISFDQKNQDVIAMVGGYDFSRSQFNRAWQAKRQTGSVFKPIIYASALDKGFTPRSIISDEPVVYKDEEADPLLQEQNAEEDQSRSPDKWKPMNYSKQFTGDTLFRNALIRSLNIPTVKLIEKIGIPWIEFYARRLDITSPLNADYTLALGSSSVTLYEMTKAFSVFGRAGRRASPVLAKKITNPKKDVILTNIGLDKKFEEQLTSLREEFEKSWSVYWENKTDTEEETSNIFFKDKDQIIPPETAYLMTSLLKGVIFDSSGTGRAAKNLDRPAAGKTGTTNGYYDSWFIGYSPEIIAGVWIGFDSQESLGRSETGSRAALPVWRDFMKTALKDQEIKEFEIPSSIVFANIDNESGYLARADSKEVVRQAFLEGTEPKEQRETLTESEDQNFLREDLAL